MPPFIRNPFRKQDENVRPTTAINGIEQRVNGTPPTKPIDIQEKEPAEYKLSEINDSGVYLPPSPPERKSFGWLTSSSRTTTSSSSGGHRTLLTDTNEQFSISRESFDSYRRSFDISARSPVIDSRPPRASLDSRTFQPEPRLPRASLDSRTFQPPPPRTSNSFTRPSQVPAQTQEEAAPEDGFEDVEIADKPSQPQQTKKRGLFSRITDSGVQAERPGSQDGKSGSSWHHFGGRKRGQSGQGAELGSIPQRINTPKAESQLRKEQPVEATKKATPVKEQPKPAPKPVESEAKVGPKVEQTQAKEPSISIETQPIEAQEPSEAQATAGAQQAADAMQELGLDDKIETQKDATPKQQAEEALKALNPQSPQAPEIKVDS